MVSKVSDICDDICGLSLLEAAEVVKILEERLGCSVAAMAAPAAAAPAAGAGATDEKSQEVQSFKLKIVSFKDASKKIAAIKFVRVLMPDYNLKDAKDYVENPPSYYNDGAVFSKEESEDLKKKFTDAGFDVGLEPA